MSSDESGIILDTNVVSEPTQQQPDQRVCARVESESEEREKMLSTDVSLRIGNVLGGNVTNSNSFSDKFNSSSDSIKMFIQATGGDPKPVFDLSLLLEEVEDFHEALSQGGGVPQVIELSPYSQLALPSDDVTFIQKQVQQAFFDELGAMFHAHMDLKHEIEYVLRNPDNFENHDVGKLQQRIRTINENLNLITQAADSCARDKSACVLPSGVVLSSGKLPKRKKKSGTPTGPGGPGVTPAILVNGINFVGPRTRKPINFQNLQANN